MGKKIALALAALGALALTGCGNGDFNAWLGDCRAEGGTAELTSIDDWGSSRYECYIDGEKVVLEGWEGE